MKILIVGGGGREHAMAWKLAQTPGVQLIASPGNPGIAAVAQCFPAPSTVDGYRELAEMFHVELTVVGPEAPLVAGIVDDFRAHGHLIIGPQQAAARLEGSKIFAKEFFRRAAIPTARSLQVTSLEAARDALKSFPLPVVIKADGLAAGKGVVIARDEAEAQDAIQALGPLLVIEEFLEGEEVSFIGLSNGESLVPFLPSQDHKRALDGDMGPNTGGMGAYCDSRIITPSQTTEIMERIMLPALWQMKREGTPFTGFLYAGLMMTAAGPKILEFNVRMGDPETQAILHSFEGDFADFLCTSGKSGMGSSQPSVCVVLAAKGYPGQPTSGDAISGIQDAEAAGATVFQAGTKQESGELLTNGGRVLGVTASGATLQQSIQAAYRAVQKIKFAGMQYRQDIAQKGLSRW